jgi:hypothetical protein
MGCWRMEAGVGKGCYRSENRIGRMGCSRMKSGNRKGLLHKTTENWKGREGAIEMGCYSTENGSEEWAAAGWKLG